jgi:hypothetical protein
MSAPKQPQLRAYSAAITTEGNRAGEGGVKVPHTAYVI